MRKRAKIVRSRLAVRNGRRLGKLDLHTAIGGGVGENLLIIGNLAEVAVTGRQGIENWRT